MVRRRAKEETRGPSQDLTARRKLISARHTMQPSTLRTGGEGGGAWVRGGRIHVAHIILCTAACISYAANTHSGKAIKQSTRKWYKTTARYTALIDTHWWLDPQTTPSLLLQVLLTHAASPHSTGQPLQPTCTHCAHLY